MDGFLTVVFVAAQLLYLLVFALDLFLFTRPVNKVDMSGAQALGPGDYPYIVLFYPVLNELETVMRTTFLSIAALDYPRDRYRVVAIPNADDRLTVAALNRLRSEFSFLEVHEVPPTGDPSWNIVWTNWRTNPKAYWWHHGPRAGDRNLPPKKTRQLIHAFYNLPHQVAGGDYLINYLDADSCPPRDHFLAAAVGMRQFDVLQAQNIAGNLNDSLAASFHAFDHMTWDGHKYPHLSADGKQPYWMLGKGLFFRASDLRALGGFHPWITIEDPEVGMRLWANGRRLGIIENPLIEEVPVTFARGVNQRTRWVAGFFQSLGRPLREIGMTPWQRFRAWLNFAPCLSLAVNLLGLPIGVWALWVFADGTSPLPRWTVGLAILNGALLAFMFVHIYWSTWRRTRLVLDSTGARLWYLLRVNPLFVMLWWTFWTVPLFLGWMMYLRGGGLVWERTEKIDANASLIRQGRATLQPAGRA